MKNNASHPRESAPADVAKEPNIEVTDSLEIKVDIDIGVDDLAAYMVTGEYQAVGELAMTKRTQMAPLGSSAEKNPMSEVVCHHGAHLPIDPCLQSPSRCANERAVEEFFNICEPDPEMMACLLAIPHDRRSRLGILQNKVLLTITSTKRNYDFMPSQEQRQAFMEETIGVSGWLESGKDLSAICLSNVAKCLLATKMWSVKSYIINGREHTAAVQEKVEFEPKADKHSPEEHLLDEDTTVGTETEVAKILSDQEQFQQACHRTDQAIDLLRPENQEKVAEMEGRQVKDWMERMQIRDVA